MGLTSIVLNTGEKPPSFTVLCHLAITTGIQMQSELSISFTVKYSWVHVCKREWCACACAHGPVHECSSQGWLAAGICLFLPSQGLDYGYVLP